MISQQFERATLRAGLKRIRFHDLRHTPATHFLEMAVHPKVVQERLGHSSIIVKLDRYSHVAPNMLQEVATKLGAAIDGA